MGLMKYLIFIFMFGCGRFISNETIELAQKLCNTNSDLKQINQYSYDPDEVICNNGSIFYINIRGENRASSNSRNNNSSGSNFIIPSPENGNGTGVPFEGI